MTTSNILKCTIIFYCLYDKAVMVIEVAWRQVSNFLLEGSKFALCSFFLKEFFKIRRFLVDTWVAFARTIAAVSDRAFGSKLTVT